MAMFNLSNHIRFVIERHALEDSFSVHTSCVSAQVTDYFLFCFGTLVNRQRLQQHLDGIRYSHTQTTSFHFAGEKVNGG